LENARLENLTPKWTGEKTENAGKVGMERQLVTLNGTFGPKLHFPPATSCRPISVYFQGLYVAYIVIILVGLNQAVTGNL